MKCMEARRMITPFVKKELPPKDTEGFLQHVESCPDCMDELDIYYTVYNALDLMDSGKKTEYDFKKMLKEELRACRRGLRRRRFGIAFRLLLPLLLVAMAFCYVLIGGREELLGRLTQGQTAVETETDTVYQLETEKETETDTAYQLESEGETDG